MTSEVRYTDYAFITQEYGETARYKIYKKALIAGDALIRQLQPAPETPEMSLAETATKKGDR